MDVQSYISYVRNAAKTQDWYQIDNMQHAIKSRFAKNQNDTDLVDFYTQTVVSSLSNIWQKRVLIEDASDFEDSIKLLLSKARDKLHQGIKAIYLEYFYDGGDCCNANIYLCTQYSDSDDYWGSEWEKSGFLEGPLVNRYLNFDPDIELPPADEIIAYEYADAILLSAVIKAWKNSEIKSLPFAFAKHDNAMIRIKS